MLLINFGCVAGFKNLIVALHANCNGFMDGLVVYMLPKRQNRKIDNLAEWSKALDLGSSPKGREFKSHSCHTHFAAFCVRRSMQDDSPGAPRVSE